MRKEVVERISFNSSMEGFAKKLEGASGGLVTLCSSYLFKPQVFYGEGNILLILVENNKNKESWFLLNVYALNTKNGRKNFWGKIKNVLARFKVGRCIIMGDFNTPLREDEKKGSFPPDLDSRTDLSDFINDLAYLDVDLQGGLFTWCNRRVGRDCI